MLVPFFINLGYIGLFAAIFAETGLLIGIFLPGDSLLFTAGIFAAAGHFNIAVILLFSFLAAVAGDSVGYYLGKRFGRRIFSRKDARFLTPERIHEAEEFFVKHGRSSIVLARFAPFVRTIVPILAGIGNMHYRTFIAFNVVGGLLWTTGMSLTGYYLGKAVPNVESYLTLILGTIVVLSLLPYVIGFTRKWMKK